MPRTLSTTLLNSIFAPETSEVFLSLLTIQHALLANDIYIVNNTEDVISNGNTFVAFAFEMAMPDESDGSLPRVSLVLDNAGQDLVTAFRTVTSPATVILEVILASDPDTVEAGPFQFLSRGAKIDSNTIKVELMYEDILNEPFPGDIFSPGTVPGVFQ